MSAADVFAGEKAAARATNNRMPARAGMIRRLHNGELWEMGFIDGLVAGLFGSIISNCPSGAKSAPGQAVKRRRPVFARIERCIEALVNAGPRGSGRYPKTLDNCMQNYNEIFTFSLQLMA